MDGTFEQAVEYIRAQGFTGFEVYRLNDAKKYVYQSDSELTLEQNIEQLRRIIPMNRAAYFTLCGWTSKAKNITRYYYEFAGAHTEDFPDREREAAVTHAPAGPQWTEEEIERRIHAAVEGVRLEHRAEELARREKDLAEREREYMEEKQSVIGIAVSQLGKLFRAYPQVAGTPHPEGYAIPADATRVNNLRFEKTLSIEARDAAMRAEREANKNDAPKA